jgi:hypothetical protein
VLIEVDPEVCGEHEGQTAAFLESGFVFVGGEVGADEGGGGPVERTVQAVRGAVAGELRRLGCGGAAHEGEVHVGEEVPSGAAPAPFPGAGGEEKAQPVKGPGDKVVHVDAPVSALAMPREV